MLDLRRWHKEILESGAAEGVVVPYGHVRYAMKKMRRQKIRYGRRFG